MAAHGSGSSGLPRQDAALNIPGLSLQPRSLGEDRGEAACVLGSSPDRPPMNAPRYPPLAVGGIHLVWNTPPSSLAFLRRCVPAASGYPAVDAAAVTPCGYSREDVDPRGGDAEGERGGGSCRCSHRCEGFRCVSRTSSAFCLLRVRRSRNGRAALSPSRSSCFLLPSVPGVFRDGGGWV